MKNKKKWLPMVLFFLILNFNNSIAGTYPPGIDKIVKNGKLIIAMYHKDIFPFIFHDQNGKLTGYDVDIAKKIAANLGVKPEFNRNSKTFNAIIDMIAQKKADIAVSLISITLNRAKKVMFTRPYLILHPVIILNRLQADNFKYKEGRNSISGIIGEKRGTSYIDFAKIIFKSPQIKKYDTWDDAVKALIDGKLSAIIRDEVGVNNLFMANPSISIRLKTIIIKNINDNIAIAVNRDSSHFCYWLNLFLKTYNSEHDVKKIISRYNKLLLVKKK